MNVLLKFLSGPQAGVETLLAPGTYVLGSSDEADLILVDATVMPRHMVLQVGVDSLQVAVEEGAVVFLDGKRITGTAKLVAYQVLTLGGVHVALGPDGQWRELPTPPRVFSESESKPEPLEHPHERKPTPNGSGQNKTVTEKQKAVLAPVVKPRNWGLTFTVIMAIAMAAVGFYQLWQYQTKPDAAGTIAEIFRRKGISFLYPATGADGQVVLNGLLANRRNQAAVARVLEQSGKEIKNEIQNAEQEVQSAADEFSGIYPNVKITHLKSGFTASLSGLVEHMAEAAEVFTLARELLDERIKIRRNLLVWSELRHEVERVAERMGMSGITFIRVKGVIEMQAKPWPDATACGALLQRLYDQHGKDVADIFTPVLTTAAKHPNLRDDIVSEEPEARETTEEPPPSPVAEVVPDTPEEEQTEPIEATLAPLLEFWTVAEIVDDGFKDHDGRVFRLGDTVGGSYRVTDTWRRGVVLQRGEETVFMKQGKTIFNK